MTKPTDAELEVLQVLWKKGAATVKEVYELIAKTKEIGYTTTLKIMQNMYEKKLVKRKPEGRGHIYEALVSEEDTQKKLLDRFLNTAFGGSAMKLVMSALGNHKATKEEIESIRKLLNQKEGGTK
ncbi:MAG: BlaI/MecI/CopY family transcriptional regulator [Bacteroidota bacterium]